MVCDKLKMGHSFLSTMAIFHKDQIYGVMTNSCPGQIFPPDLCWSTKVNMGSLVDSLSNIILTWQVNLGGQPCLGQFVVVPYSFYFYMMDLIVLCEMFKAWDIF